jgi:hypothetical protein
VRGPVPLGIPERAGGGSAPPAGLRQRSRDRVSGVGDRPGTADGVSTSVDIGDPQEQ